MAVPEVKICCPPVIISFEAIQDDQVEPLQQKVKGLKARRNLRAPRVRGPQDPCLSQRHLKSWGSADRDEVTLLQQAWLLDLAWCP